MPVGSNLGASPDGDRATRPTDHAPAGRGDTASVPSAQFTPGPWHVFASSFAASHHNAVEINDPGGLTVAWAQKFVPPYVGQSEANAHLIAAAPELYEALVVVTSCGAVDPTNTAIVVGHDASVVLQQAWAAIAKARGEQS